MAPGVLMQTPCKVAAVPKNKGKGSGSESGKGKGAAKAEVLSRHAQETAMSSEFPIAARLLRLDARRSSGALLTEIKAGEGEEANGRLDDGARCAASLLPGGICHHEGRASNSAVVEWQQRGSRMRVGNGVPESISHCMLTARKGKSWGGKGAWSWGSDGRLAKCVVDFLKYISGPALNPRLLHVPQSGRWLVHVARPEGRLVLSVHSLAKELNKQEVQMGSCYCESHICGIGFPSARLLAIVQSSIQLRLRSGSLKICTGLVWQVCTFCRAG